MKKVLLCFSLLFQTVCFAQTGILENFNDNVVNAGWVGVPASKFKFTETDNTLKVEATAVGADWSNFEFNFASQNISANPVVKIKVKNTAAFNLRIDLVDDMGNATNSNPINLAVASNQNYLTLTYNFAGKFGACNSTKIVKAVLFINPGVTAFTGTVNFDDLTIGDAIPIVPTLPTGPIRINQLGYELKGPKIGILELATATNTATTFDIIDDKSTVAFSGPLVSNGQVPGWTGRYFWTVDFSAFQKAGKYRIKIGNQASYEFTIAENLLFNSTAASVVDFFKGMRSTNNADRTLSFNGTRNDIVNVYGGWWDATGDPGKHISHLSYANYFNPQQIPFVVWSLLRSYELDNAAFAAKATDLKSEAAWGADYLLRNLDKDGYFYLSVFDDWGNSPSSREITEWGAPGSDSQRSPNYQCSFREGGGISIAALARAYTMNIAGDSTKTQYLNGAKRAYAHLTAPGTGYSTKSIQYDNDHKENIIDDYCALFAAVELYKATGTASYKTDAEFRVQKLLGRQNTEGYFYSDDAAKRPFFHGADEGMPILALLAYMDIDPSKNSLILPALKKNINWYITSSTSNNPFQYLRQYRSAYVSSALQAPQSAFFMPHDNETGYWWQGENARIASLTSAFLQTARKINPNYELGSDPTSKFAMAQLDWIIGKNPFDLSMIYGFGNKTYPTYPTAAGKQNIKGGICNGISSKDKEEGNLAWMPYEATDWQNWRWIEQWLPHDCWYLLSVSSVSNLVHTTGSAIAEFGPLTIVPSGSNQVFSWSTKFELNGKSFIIEKSSNGSNYTTVVEVPATGAADKTSQYTVTDKVPNAGSVIYRITFYDLNGNAIYVEGTSTIITATFESASAITTPSVMYPNPCSHSVQLYVPKSNGVSGKVFIRDLSGNLKEETTVVFGENAELGVSLSPGVYTVEIVSEKGVETQKLVKTY